MLNRNGKRRKKICICHFTKTCQIQIRNQHVDAMVTEAERLEIKDGFEFFQVQDE